VVLIKTYKILNKEQMKKLILLTLILLTSLSSFSQIDTTKVKVTDTSRVVLPYRVAKLVVKDLIAGDLCKKENELLNLKTLKLLEIDKQKDSTIFLLNEKSENYESILLIKDEQITQYENLKFDLTKELKKEKQKKGFYKAVSVVGGIAIGILLLTK